MRHFDHKGVLTAAAFETLGDHFKEPQKELGRQPNLPWNFYQSITGGGGVIRARNIFASDFYTQTSNDEDILFFVDYDLMPTAQNYVDVLMRMKDPNISICGGLYTTRADDGHYVINQLPRATPGRGGLLQVMELGTGFKAYKRKVFRKAIEDNPWLVCEPENRGKPFYGFFSAGPVWDKQLWPGRGRWLTEDYWFDWLCRESGFAIFADTKIKLRHKDDFTGKVFPKVWPSDPGSLPEEAQEL
jgi:hypothetical protein